MIYYHVNSASNIHTVITTRTGKRVPYQLIAGELLTPVEASRLDARIAERYLIKLNVKPSEMHRSFGVRFLNTTK